MLREAEQMVRPLEEVFDRKSVNNLGPHDVKGVILIEAPIDALMDIAKRKGYKGEWVDPHPDPVWRQAGIGMYWFYPKEEGESPLVLYTKKLSDGKAVYIFEDEFERFNDMFVER